MSEKNFRYIYGPVYSWRLGRSLGIDPISREKKICTFDCVYCQIGETRTLIDKRDIFIPEGEIIKEIKSLPRLEIDYITFSGRGEPTLARNLGGMINGIKKIRKEKVAIITNSSLIDRKDVQDDLVLADLVMAKLDAHSKNLFSRINKPVKGITFDKILRGIKEFKSTYSGKLALQIMFVRENKACALQIAEVVKDIAPDEVQLGTPLRPCGAKPISSEEMDNIKGYFKGMNIVSVYDAKKKKVDSINKEATLKRRGS